MGRHFWVGRGYFSWGDGGGRESARTWSAGSVAGRHTISNSPIFFDIYYMLSSGSFAGACLQAIVKGVLDPRLPWTDTCAVSGLDKTSTYTTH
jgi:hypothetical protein